MPRVKTLIRETGTSGRLERFELTGDPRTDVARAVEMEHPCADDSCDIGVALREGFPFSAAHILVSATEAPLLDSVLALYQLSQIDWPSDWNEWVAWHKEHGHECKSCGSYTYDNDNYSPDQCGNCLAPFPVNAYLAKHGGSDRYVWPGGYARAAIVDDGETLCAACVNDPTNPVHEGGDADGWRIEGWTHTGETDDPMHCGHCGGTIE